jgi:hypothetical protein
METNQPTNQSANQPTNRINEIMSATEKNDKGEILVLGHNVWPGFKTAFLIIFGGACLYLTVILYNALQHLPGGH